MATYVTSDIHGELKYFEKLLKMVDFKDADTLYVLGDNIDRGPKPMETVQKIMHMKNAHCLLGNHEAMALDALEYLDSEYEKEDVEKFDEDLQKKTRRWLKNGSDVTIRAFRALDRERKDEIIDFWRGLKTYEEINVNGTDYVLVHAGLGNFSEDKGLNEYTQHELVWTRDPFDVCYYKDKVVVAGHTPTQELKDNPKPGGIFKKNNRIDVDCGSCYTGGRLAMLCLDTGEEFYYPKRPLLKP